MEHGVNVPEPVLDSQVAMTAQQDSARVGAATPIPASANLGHDLNLALAQRLAWL